MNNKTTNTGKYMTKQEFIELTYEYFESFGITEQYLYYRTNQPYLTDDSYIYAGPLNTAFIWETTPEGHSYWEAINRKQDSRLRIEKLITNLELFQAIEELYNKSQHQPYEYW